MDFSFSDDQQSLRELAVRVFSDLSTPSRLREVDDTEDHFDAKLWSELGAAGLLGISLPESVGGAGLGFLEACIVAEEAGRCAAAVPLVASTVLGAGPIAQFGTEAAQQRYLPAVASGSGVLSAALAEPGGDPWAPTTTARRSDSGWRLEGTKSYVPGGHLAEAIVVPARLDDGGMGLFIIEQGAPGITTHRQLPTDGQIEVELELDGVAVEGDNVLVAGEGGAEALDWLLERASAAICVQVAGACQEAVRLTAKYTTERVQFDKPIATFQAVGQRAADAYIDAEAVKLTAWQAAWRLSEGLPAAPEVAVAKFWADDGAQRVVHAAQHLHGGMGVDRDYPLHRYYLTVKHLALTLGGGTASLLRLGNFLADEPV
jgi:3-oxocholest-4-en-26-oyl-CoA dehydrogenase beta subunit